MQKLMRIALAVLLALTLITCGDQMDDQNQQGQGAAGNAEEMADTTRLDAARGGMGDTMGGMMDTTRDTLDTLPDTLRDTTAR